MNSATQLAALHAMMTKVRELWEAHIELALAEGGPAETEARARRNALTDMLHADEKRLATNSSWTALPGPPALRLPIPRPEANDRAPSPRHLSLRPLLIRLGTADRQVFCGSELHCALVGYLRYVGVIHKD